MENEKTYLEQVGERFKQMRNRNYLSRKELAERTDVHISEINKLERGKEAIGIEDAVKLCNELDCSIEYILTGDLGVTELAKLNQKILNLPDIHSDNLKKMAQAFWSNCPKH